MRALLLALLLMLPAGAGAGAGGNPLLGTWKVVGGEPNAGPYKGENRGIHRDRGEGAAPARLQEPAL